MSRYHPSWDITPILEAAAHGRDFALVGGGSVLTTTPVWSDESLDLMNEYYVLNLEYGEDSFLEKFERQLEGAPPVAKQLAAENERVQRLFDEHRAKQAASTQSAPPQTRSATTLRSTCDIWGMGLGPVCGC